MSRSSFMRSWIAASIAILFLIGLVGCGPKQPVLPVQEGTPYPQPSAVITLGTASQVKLLATWSVGSQGEWIRSLHFSPDGKILIFIGMTTKSGTITKSTPVEFLDTTNGQVLRTLAGLPGAVFSVSISPDGKILATAMQDGPVILWDFASGQKLLTLTGHSMSLQPDHGCDVEFSPDGKSVFGGSPDTTLIQWDVASGQVIKTFKNQNGDVWAEAFSPDGMSMASSSADDTIVLEDVASGKVLHTLNVDDVPVGVAFSPDGKVLASGTLGTYAILWDVATGKRLHYLNGAHSDEVKSIAFSPDGKLLADASNDNTVVLWDVNSAKALITLKGFTHWLWGIAFSPDGRILATSDGDGTIRIWGVAP